MLGAGARSPCCRWCGWRFACVGAVPSGARPAWRSGRCIRSCSGSAAGSSVSWSSSRRCPASRSSTSCSPYRRRLADRARYLPGLGRTATGHADEIHGAGGGSWRRPQRSVARVQRHLGRPRSLRPAARDRRSGGRRKPDLVALDIAWDRQARVSVADDRRTEALGAPPSEGGTTSTAAPEPDSV